MEGVEGTLLKAMPETRSGSRLIRRWRVLVAHDARSPTCDALIRALHRVLDSHPCGENPSGDVELGDELTGARGVDLVDCSSVDDACEALESSAFDLCLVCLDLPPVPHGGARMANLVLDVGNPLLLVTRSLRWLPATADALRSQSWVRPEVDDDALRSAIAVAVSNASASWPAPRAPGDLEADTDIEAGGIEAGGIEAGGFDEGFEESLEGDDPRSGSRPSYPGIFTLPQDQAELEGALSPSHTPPSSHQHSHQHDAGPLDEDTDAGLERTSQVG